MPRIEPGSLGAKQECYSLCYVPPSSFFFTVKSSKHLICLALATQSWRFPAKCLELKQQVYIMQLLTMGHLQQNFRTIPTAPNYLKITNSKAIPGQQRVPLLFHFNIKIVLAPSALLCCLDSATKISLSFGTQAVLMSPGSRVRHFLHIILTGYPGPIQNATHG